MSKRMKVLVSVLVAVLLLTVGSVAAVLADEEPTPAPEAGSNGLLARVAEILDIPQENLVNAFRQAQQEIRQETRNRFLEKAIEQGRITQDEADDILNWWEQRPETCDRLMQRARICEATYSRHMWGGHRGWHGPMLPMPAD